MDPRCVCWNRYVSDGIPIVLKNMDNSLTKVWISFVVDIGIPIDLSQSTNQSKIQDKHANEDQEWDDVNDCAADHPHHEAHLLEDSDEEHDFYEWLGDQQKLHDNLNQIHVSFLELIFIAKHYRFPRLIKLGSIFTWTFDCVVDRQPLGKKVDVEYELGHLKNVEKLSEVAKSQISQLQALYQEKPDRGNTGEHVKYCQDK